MPRSTAGPSAMARGEESAGTPLRDVILEFGRHLDILAEQLGASVIEAERDCVSVGDSFHAMAGARSSLESIECPEPSRSVLRDSCSQIGESLQTAVIALQYHDRLSQRLELVRSGLSRLLTLLHDDSPRSYDEWLTCLREVEQVNRVEQQRLAPKAAQNQPSVHEINLSQSSVELF